MHKKAVSAGSCTEWNNPITVTVKTSLQYPYRPDVATDGSSNLYVTWMDQRVSRGWWNLYAQKYSAGGGKAWIDDLKVNQTEPLGATVVQLQHRRGRVSKFYVAWGMSRSASTSCSCRSSWQR